MCNVGSVSRLSRVCDCLGSAVFERCVDLCKTAMEVVLQRLPLHYKAMYHLANIFYCVPHMKDLDKSYEYLMGSCKTGKSTINGLFKDRKSSNFFSVSLRVWPIGMQQ